MSLLPFSQWLAATPGSIALHESLYMYPLVESTHVITLCLFVGMSLVWDLRLLGVMLPNVPMTTMNRKVWPFMLVGFIIMSITGVLLFYAIPVRTYQSIFFRIKVILLVLAGLNVWMFHSNVWRRVAEWDQDAVPPRSARWAGALSLLFWICIIFAGRMIAYNWFDCDRQPQSAFVNWAAGCVVESE